VESGKMSETEKVIVEKKKTKPAAKRAGMHVRAKKKTAVARAVIKKGKGIVKINHMNLDAYAEGHLRDMIREPLIIAQDVAPEYDINVTVKGSGNISQAFAVRSSIAKAIVRAKGKKYKDLFLLYDRALLVDDMRQVETKKPLGPKARKRKQQSKR
jgi:small subunit ribosomal protein S9